MLSSNAITASGAADHLQETYTIGRHTREKLLHTANCPELTQYGINYTGLSDAATPYAMTRLRPKVAHLLVCLGGEGEVMTDGRWKKCRAGDAYLSRAGVPHAFRAIPKRRWQFAFAIYDRPRSWLQYLPPVSTLAQGDGYVLSAALEGLYREVGTGARADIRLHWISLIDAYWRQIVESRARIGRLSCLWEKVDQELAHPWSVERLAEHVGLSRAQLRRVSRIETDLSPMTYVTKMRMSRAVTLLQTSTLKIEAIAEAVGYANPFAFSSAFRRCMGCPPSRYMH